MQSQIHSQTFQTLILTAFYCGTGKMLIVNNFGWYFKLKTVLELFQSFPHYFQIEILRVSALTRLVQE